MVTYLRRLKTSSVPQDQDLFACMIHGVFDEYHCYPSYPLQALATTSVLFSSIIVYKLIDEVPLRGVLAMVWQAVRDHDPSSTMYKIGLQALVQFKDRLKEWKSYCGLLAQIAQDVISGNVDRPSELSVNGNIDQGEPGAVLTNGDSNASSPESPQHPPFRSLDPTMPFRDPSTYTELDEKVQDGVLFILNNVSNSNLEAKLEFLKEHLREEHHQWFADYLVVERAKHEQNYHKLYLDVLDKYNGKGLIAEVLRETYVNVIKLLNAEPTLNSSNERAHLKNLACWLGGLTILKLYLKFEIEVLCKIWIWTSKPLNLQQASEELEIGQLRKKRRVYRLLKIFLYTHKIFLYTYKIFLPPQIRFPLVPAGFADHVIRILQLAMDCAIMEIIRSVVERSATIASISTSQLIQKDFATEGDEGKMRNTAHIVVRHLARGLALVMCKGPLRMSMQNNIRALLAKSRYNEQVITDQTITVCVNDNIDIACQIIEKATQERAIPDIDDGLN
ncbi:hypothetical protein B9Z19DRAFT_1067482 [Tuber borchii]|uniref:Uncharacterized protein n=1 Tax=Tuber borchii TaxID=42251 RepID=A0A2T6ZIR6_TUBBO|nr:hypothetical protein B9Z19DRAFT_1067482 [Tuber borchii]